jgi:hypothetical protein
MTDSAGDRLLLGAVVERVDVIRRAAVLRVRVPGETWLVLLGCGSGTRVGILPDAARERVKGVLGVEARDPGMRRALEGARIEGIEARGVRLGAEGRNFRLAAGPRVVRIQAIVAGDEARVAQCSERDAWVARGEELLRSLAPLLLQDAKDAVTATLAKEKRKLERRVLAIGEDLARATDAQELATKARWFVAEAARAPRGASELTVTDWSTGDARAITLPLDPAKSARDQIEAIFARARRLQRGMEVARARRTHTENAILLLRAKLLAVQDAGSQADIDRVIGSSSSTATALERTRPPKGKKPERRPYRLFRTSLGAPILAGRSASDNDALTFRIARPHDLWLHARGVEGAHVVLPIDKGKEPSTEALVDAAHLAAHFSGYRAENSVEVQYAERGRVRKPRGSPPGLVVVDQARAIIVRMEPIRLARLLASEDPA